MIGRALAPWLLAAGAALMMSTVARAQSEVARTKHNLAPGGPGEVRAAGPSGVCVFCHTPHNASPTRGLWNHELPAVTYQIYASSTSKARINQPTGSSRLCLSCHDGVLALGNLRASPPDSASALGRLKGSAVLGTDLSNDHPVSFVYDGALALSRADLADPGALPPSVRLDESRQLQCTTCHDAHEDRRADFLRMDNRSGAMCLACHRPRGWSGSSHATSTAAWNGSGTNPWPKVAYPTVAENACLSCHRSHAASHPQRLLAQGAEPANCTICHGGTVASTNIENEFLKPFRHPIESNQWVHEPSENPALAQRHVACADCHNPHATTSVPGVAPAVSGRLRGVSGVALGGSLVAEASFEYEVCSKCHGMTEPLTPGIVRQSGTRNIRLKIDPSNRSYHPIAAAGVSATLPGLKPEFSPSSIISCTSCHNSDDWTASGRSPRGPHGSRFEPILERQYVASDPSPESPQSYDLCYKCHNRDFLINDQAGTFPHRRHVVDRQTPCAACHDAHGSRQGEHLIDFMIRDRTGNPVVTPSAAQRRTEFTSLGRGHGQCYLQCHGVNHEPKAY